MDTSLCGVTLVAATQKKNDKWEEEGEQIRQERNDLFPPSTIWNSSVFIHFLFTS